jgi:hypothetical protein
VHKKREENHNSYIKLEDASLQLDSLIKQLELNSIDFKICLKIAGMFLKEDVTLKKEFEDLKIFEQKLNKEIKALNHRFRGGNL